MQTLKILARAVSNLTDARFFASWEADWLVFDLDPSSSNYLPPVKAAAIKAWVEGPAIAGAFGFQDAEEVAAISEELELDALLAGMFMPLEAVQETGARFPLLKEIVVDRTGVAQAETLMTEWAPFTAYFVLDLQKNDIRWEDIRQGRPFGVPWLSACCARYPVLLAIDLDPQILREVISEVRPSGFCLQGGEEEKTGFKSFEALDELLEQLRA